MEWKMEGLGVVGVRDATLIQARARFTNKSKRTNSPPSKKLQSTTDVAMITTMASGVVVVASYSTEVSAVVVSMAIKDHFVIHHL